MSNTYFDASTVAISDGTRGDAPDVNNVASATETGFGLLPEPDPLKQGRVSWYTQTGTADTYTITTGLSLASYPAGLEIDFLVVDTNTGASTINIDAVGAVAITTLTGGALPAGALTAGQVAKLKSDGTNLVLMQTSSATDAASAAASAAAAGVSETNAAASAAAAGVSETNAAASAAAAGVSAAELVINWTTPIQVGSDLNIAGVTGGASISKILSSGSTTWVAYIDTANEDLRTYAFDYSAGTWSQVGNDLNIATIGITTISMFGGLIAAFYDSTNAELRAYTFDGTDWTQTGNGLTISGATGGCRMAPIGNNATDIALVNGGIDELRTYRWDGSDWSQVGNGLAITDGNGGLCNMTNTRVASYFNSRLYAYDWDGVDWVQVGNPYVFSGAVVPSDLTALNSTDVWVFDPQNQSEILRFDGTDWAIVSYNFAPSSATSGTVTALNGTDVAYFDSINDDLRVYRWGYQLGDGPSY